jgi:hypothetical protein
MYYCVRLMTVAWCTGPVLFPFAVLPVLLAGYLVTWLQGSLAGVDSDFEPISDSGFICSETSRLLLVLALTVADAGVDSDFEPISDSGVICSEPLLTTADNDSSRFWTSYSRFTLFLYS